MKIKNYLFSTLAAVTISLSTLTFVQPAYADVTMYDNFFSVGNNTVTQGDPAQTVNAAPQNIVEYFIRVRNTGSEDAKDVQVWAALPSDSGTSLVTTAYIRPNNPDRVNVQISDTTTVNVTGGQPVGLRFLAGHTRFAGVTNKFNCPNSCDINDQDILKGIDVGDVPAGQEVQVAFKAFLTNVPAASASPAPIVAPTPAPTQTPNIQCLAGQTQQVSGSNIICINNNNVNNNTNNNNSSSNQSQSVNVTTVAAPSSSPTVVVASTVSNVKELPNTGLPVAGLALAGLTPIGLKLKKFGKGIQSLTPNFMWEQRQFKK